jgi:SRSO17 transposase
VLRTYRRRLAQAFADPADVIVIDDTGFAKKGRHSVGVARQYSGTLGKTDDCQVAVSLHYAAPNGDYPRAVCLFLPDSRTSQPERMEAARIPTQQQEARTKGEIALDLLDQVRGEGLPHRGVVVDAGYGMSVDFRRGLGKRNESYVVGIASTKPPLPRPPAGPCGPKSRAAGRRRVDARITLAT